MDRFIRWLSEASDDLSEIEAYIARDSVRQSKIVSSTITRAPLMLGDFPFAGPTVAEDESGIHRQLRCYSYRIIYRVEHEILIVAVIHCARLLPRSIFRRK